MHTLFAQHQWQSAFGEDAGFAGDDGMRRACHRWVRHRPRRLRRGDCAALLRECRHRVPRGRPRGPLRPPRTPAAWWAARGPAPLGRFQRRPRTRRQGARRHSRSHGPRRSCWRAEYHKCADPTNAELRERRAYCAQRRDPTRLVPGAYRSRAVCRSIRQAHIAPWRASSSGLVQGQSPPCILC